TTAIGSACVLPTDGPWRKGLDSMILSLRRVKPLAQFISSSQVRYRNAARRPHGTTRIRNEEVFHAGAVQISPLNLTAPSIRPVYPAPGHVESDFTRMNQ